MPGNLGIIRTRAFSRTIYVYIYINVMAPRITSMITPARERRVPVGRDDWSPHAAPSCRACATINTATTACQTIFLVSYRRSHDRHAHAFRCTHNLILRRAFVPVHTQVFRIVYTQTVHVRLDRKLLFCNTDISVRNRYVSLFFVSSFPSRYMLYAQRLFSAVLHALHRFSSHSSNADTSSPSIHYNHISDRMHYSVSMR